MSSFCKELFALSGKVALVTGGGAGIGRTMATALAKAGASVVVAARREEQLAQTAAQIAAQGGNCEFVAADLSEADRLPKFVEQASQPFGSPDILVNAAGVNLRQPADKITLESWEQTLGIKKSPLQADGVFWTLLRKAWQN